MPRNIPQDDPMNAQSVTITDWAHLQHVLFDDSWNPHILRHRSRHLFRGQGCAGFDLASGLARLGRPHIRLEKHLLRNFRKYAKSYLRRDENLPDNMWHWMALAQHHGLPTRLLDWTYSPLIAAHFACCELGSFHLDGVIWKVDFDATHDLLSDNLRDCLRRQGAHVFTDEMLTTEIDSQDQLSVSHGEGEEQVLFFEPPSLSGRIVNQFACFSVQVGQCGPMTDWLLRHPDLWTRIVIPAALKWEIRDKLDQSNISERVLFPGLDGLCSWLARQYYPRG